VRLIEEARAQHRKDVKDAKRSAAGRERAEAAGGDAARIAAALAADRAERAAAAPVRERCMCNGGAGRIAAVLATRPVRCERAVALMTAMSPQEM
jgi:hypothetical protein